MGNHQDRHSSDPAGSQVESSHANKIGESSSFNQQPPPSRLSQSSDINRGPSSTSSLVRSTNGNLLLPASSHINSNIRVEHSTHQHLPSNLAQSSTISRNSSSGSSIAKNSSQNGYLLVTTAQSSLVQRNNGAGAIPKRYKVIGFNISLYEGV